MLVTELQWSFVWDALEDEIITPDYEVVTHSPSEVRVAKTKELELDFYSAKVLTPEYSYNAIMRGVCTNFNAVYSYEFTDKEILEALKNLPTEQYYILQFLTEQSKNSHTRLRDELDLTRRLMS